jgi:hypothetical protein
MKPEGLIFVTMTDEQYLKEGKIDTTEQGIIYWSQKLKCTPKDLKDSICKIGDSYNVLVLYLEMNRLIKRD